MENVNYRGREIKFSEGDFKFCVQLESEYKRFGSLAGAKKAVDKEIDAAPFKEFKVVMLEGYRPEKARVMTVVGARSEKRRSRNWGTEETWYYTVKDSAGKTRECSERSDVYRVEDLPKVEKLLKQKHDNQKKIDALEKVDGALGKKMEELELRFGNFIE
jgi:hypothetical protein